MIIKYDNQIKKESYKVVSATLAVLLIMVIIFLNNRIPHYEIDLNQVATPETNRFEIDTHNPYSLKSFFLPYDISISSYTYILNERADKVQLYGFQNPYEYCNFFTENKVDDDLTNPLALVILPDENAKSISFFAKFLTSEDLQSIRTFFYSEILAMLLAVLGLRIYKLINYHYRKKYGRSIPISSKLRFKLIVSYLCLALLAFSTIIIISRKQHVIIQNKTFIQDSSWLTFFEPYDISKTYYQFQVNLSKETNDTIKWMSSDIVEFKDFSREPEIRSSKYLEFYPLYVSTGFHVSFCTENFVLKNLQDIRVFVLSTFMLLFLARMIIHIKELFVLKKREYNKKHKH